MATYRGVLMVPSVIEFESDGAPEHVTEQARRIARGLGKTKSACRKHTYAPTVLEVVRAKGTTPTPDQGESQGMTNLDIDLELA